MDARKRAVAISVGGILAACAVLVVSSPASAHNYYAASTPAEGETLTELPKEFVVTTNDVLLDLGNLTKGFAIAVQDAQGLYYGDGCVTVDGASISTPAALGDPGEYTLTWNAISADSHSAQGTFMFDWQPTADKPTSVGSNSQPDCDGKNGSASGETPEQDTGEPRAKGSLSDLLWIGGALGAVAATAVVTVLLLRRKK